jgi:hypothetical protein
MVYPKATRSERVSQRRLELKNSKKTILEQVDLKKSRYRRGTDRRRAYSENVRKKRTDTTKDGFE